jgi:hypothetical protein
MASPENFGGYWLFLTLYWLYFIFIGYFKMFGRFFLKGLWLDFNISFNVGFTGVLYFISASELQDDSPLH